jgi:hypothetical protein
VQDHVGVHYDDVLAIDAMLETVVQVTTFEMVWGAWELGATQVLKSLAPVLSLQSLAESFELILATVIQNQHFKTILGVVQAQSGANGFRLNFSRLIAARQENVYDGALDMFVFDV